MAVVSRLGRWMPASWRWPTQAGWVRLALVAFLLAAVLPSPTVLSQIGPGASLTVVRGSVSVTRPDGTAIYPAGTGLTLAVGDIVGTLERTRAIVTFFTGSEVELGSNTTIIIRRLDRDLLDEAAVWVEDVIGMSVIRIPQAAGKGSGVRVLHGDTVALILAGEVGHGVDPTTNNVTVACVDGPFKCRADAVAFPNETSFLPGQMARTLTGKGDLVDQSIPRGTSVWDALAAGGAVGAEDGTTQLVGGQPRSNTDRVPTDRGKDRDKENDGQPNPVAQGSAPTPTFTPTPTPTSTLTTPPTATPPPGPPGPPCGSPQSDTGGPGTFVHVHSVGKNQGTFRFHYNPFLVADQFVVAYEGTVLFDTGLTTTSTFKDITFGPGASTFITVTVMTGTGSTVWSYTVDCVP